MATGTIKKPQTIQYGDTAATRCAAGETVDVSIVFDTPFAREPLIIVGFRTGSTAAGFGNCSVSTVPTSISTTGFDARIFNNDSAARAPVISWIAIG